MTSDKKWTEDDVPDMAGKTVLVTGANSGLGFETARVLATHKAHVILACRSEDKAVAAMDAIAETAPDASLEFQALDLSSLASVLNTATEVQRKHGRLDRLINNAGVMWLPPSRTEDGFEMHFGTNHLGHFALTGKLLPLLLKTPGSRIVTLSSIGHRIGDIYFDDLWLEKGYGKQKAYSQSKLANLIFAHELQRRLEKAGADTISVAAHPGIAGTNLATPALHQMGFRRLGDFAARVAPWVTRTPAKGALPTLYAATMPDVRGGDYFGPHALFEIIGHPARGESRRRALDPQRGKKLWALSEELTGVTFPMPDNG